ncbi:maleylpyruvate isomerase family mycothiol-dependent enzyme [Luteipulveratus mongoliensis]|uniref:Mycothiol-dependent maleylpyruvate isomerase metal-binding domain-containing protein n=1 Tax=Luteipulveratus mongoliensis TaxID=571913 RepID=A0A0K1JK69_9MICO|nr:maleylpyruvate isomerase family mycothiol-dependent enzyme [Luteipulveratus mongoliensis]AKU16970.1 hypothetical protein VV02_15730 [Luteipulveratus mongoliensis]
MESDHRKQLLAGVLRTMQGVVDGMGPDDLGRVTPCAEYDVRRLVEHIVGWQQVFAASAAGLEPPLADGSPTYVASEDVSVDQRAASLALLESLESAGPTLTMPYRGETPTSVLVDELIAESVIHTWDLATSLGLEIAFEHEAVAVAHVGLTALLGESFAAEGFAQQSGPASGGDLVALLRRSGRSPVGESWHDHAGDEQIGRGSAPA